MCGPRRLLVDKVQVGPELIRSNKEMNAIYGVGWGGEEIVVEYEVKICSIVHGCECMEQW